VLVWPEVGRATSLSVISEPLPPLSVRMPELFTVTKLLRTVELMPWKVMPYAPALLSALLPAAVMPTRLLRARQLLPLSRM